MAKSLLQVDPQLDTEEASDESLSDEAPSTQLPVSRRRKFIKGAGLALTLAALVGTACVSLRGKPEPPNSASHLMHSEEFHHAVRERALLAARTNGHELSSADADREISQDLSTIFTYVEKNYPEISQKLKDSELSTDQSKALITLLERQHDKRLKDLGEKTIQVVLANALFGPKAVRERLVEKFRPEMPKVMAMYKEIVPAPIREAKAKWYHAQFKRRAADGDDNDSNPLDSALEFLLHPRAISIMKTFGSPANDTSAAAKRQLATSPSPSPNGLDQPMPVKLGVGISGFALNSVNMLVMELSQLLDFTMPWWGWLLTLLPGVSLGTTSCIIAPIDKSYSDFWCLDFLMFTGLQALEVLAAGAFTFVHDD